MSDNPSETRESRTEPKVITVTLNPSLDRMLTTHFLAIGYHNRTTETTRLYPGGRGVNISRALHSLGIPTHAIILIGHDATGRAYQALLAEEEFPISILRREGLTRSNITIYDNGQNKETVILEESEGATQHELHSVADTLVQLINADDWVVFAGSLPNGVRTDTYAWLTSVAQTATARVAINAGGGEPLRQSLQARPGLIYMTQTQLEGLFNFPVRTYEDVVYCAQKLREQRANHVLVAMTHEERAVLVTDESVWMVELTDETVSMGTRGGQAEAMIAGYLAGRLNQRPFDEALELAAAAAAYTGSQVGAEFGTLREVEDLSENVSVTEVDGTADIRQKRYDEADTQEANNQPSPPPDQPD